MRVRLGIDLDNTLIDYQTLFSALATESGFTLPVAADKAAVRTAVCAQADDLAWQRLQAQAYGPLLHRAILFPLVNEALQALTQKGVELWIISHKTAFSPLDTLHKHSLHEAALDFLEEQGVLSMLPRERIVFAPDRAAKCKAIARVACTHFVDDLPEVFADASFPPSVQRILFSPNLARLEALPDNTSLLAHWGGMVPLLFSEGEPLSGGRNSRVFALTPLSGLPPVVEKRYPCPGSASEDAWRRPKAEWIGLHFLRDNGLVCVPQPLAFDAGNTRAFFTRCPGEGAPPVTQQTLMDMVNFTGSLYRLRGEPVRELPPASDACFCLDALKQQLEQRLTALRSCTAGGAEEAEMRDFLEGRLAPEIHATVRRAETLLQQVEISATAALPLSCRMPSPSDFGVHNALLQEDGTVTYVDFEYFGQDDPVKLLSDVCLHPAMNLDATLGKVFVQGCLREFAAAGGEQDAHFRTRFRAFFPLWRLKWCFILLNEFLPCHEGRRRFAAGDVSLASSHTPPCDKSWSAVLRTQLGKAQHMMDTTYDADFLFI